MAARPRLATIEIIFFLATIFFAALNVHRALTWLPLAAFGVFTQGVAPSSLGPGLACFWAFGPPRQASMKRQIASAFISAMLFPGLRDRAGLRARRRRGRTAAGS
jgi:hypothetical protein